MSDTITLITVLLKTKKGASLGANLSRHLSSIQIMNSRVRMTVNLYIKTNQDREYFLLNIFQNCT